MKKFDVIVIGVGSMGAATCCELARRGASVLGIEQFNIANDRAAHHGESRMVRRAYFEHPNYVALLDRALSMWRQLNDHAKQPIYHETGGLYIGPPDCELVSGSLSSAQEHDLEHEMLDRAQLADRFPQFQLPDHFVGFWETQAGLVIPELTVSSYADMARAHGASLYEQEAVTAWEADAHSVTVRTDRDAYRADRAVICSGAWSGRLLAELGLPLKVTRQTIAWIDPHESDLFSIDRFPCWAIDQHPKDAYCGVHYGFPMLPGATEFKIARHAPGEPCDPDTVDRSWRDTDDADVRQPLRDLIPQANGPAVRHGVCLYTNTPDGHFIIDQHPKHDRVTIACGFAGHGFKFVPVMGEVLADLALDGYTDLPVAFLSLARFA